MVCTLPYRGNTFARLPEVGMARMAGSVGSILPVRLLGCSRTCQMIHHDGLNRTYQDAMTVSPADGTSWVMSTRSARRLDGIHRSGGPRCAHHPWLRGEMPGKRPLPGNVGCWISVRGAEPYLCQPSQPLG